MKCPNCSNNMDQGYIGSESFISGMKWFTKIKVLGTGGELMASPDMTGMVYLKAFRCMGCRTVIFRY